ncbi:4038_t:CDS:2, partial [Scutellospora calospora]
LNENGFDPKIFLEISKYLESTNELTNVDHMKLTCSLGEWSGRHGEYILETLKNLYESTTYMPEYMGISKSDYQRLIADFDEQCNQNKSYLEVHRYIAKKI